MTITHIKLYAVKKNAVLIYSGKTAVKKYINHIIYNIVCTVNKKAKNLNIYANIFNIFLFICVKIVIIIFKARRE